jgi:hypothetical protein
MGVPNMKKSLSLLFTVILLLVSATALWAAPSFYGYTGLLFVPTAATLETGEFNIAVQTINLDLGSLSGGSFTYGTTDKWEAGIAVANQDLGIIDGTLVNTKLRISNFGDVSIISVGGIFPFEGSNSTIYGVLSQRMVIPGIDANPITGHIGWGSGGILDGIFIGLDGIINPRTTAMLEYDSSNLNTGVRFALSEEFRATAALFDFSDLGLQVSYNRRF